jgi:adenosylhomocysteine nucleosidase
MNVLIVTPTRREGAAFISPKLTCGTGPAAGAVIAERLAREPFDAVAVAGVCGGLDPSLAPGDLILATRVGAPGKPDLTPDTGLLAAVQRSLHTAGRRFVSAGLLTVDQPVASTTEKRDLWNAYGAAGVDMETYAVVETVQARGLPWFALRAVVDPAGSTLPAPLRAWRGEEDERALLFALLHRPQDWLTAVALARRMSRATDALARAVPLALGAAKSLPAPTTGP